MPAPRTDRRRRAAVAGAVPWAVWAALRATGTERGFPLVPVMAFTKLGAAASLLPLGISLALRSRVATLLAGAAGAALTAGALAHRGRRIPPPTTPPGDRLRVATVSLLRGQVPVAAVIDLVRRYDVDVLSASELAPPVHIQLRDAGLDRLLPSAHLLLAPPGTPPAGSGGIWSRRPVTSRTVVPGTWQQPAIRLTTAVGEVEVTAVHAKAPAWSPSSVRAWMADLAALPSPDPAVLRVLAGDFNATPDHAAFRAVLSRGYRDAAAACGAGRAWTWRPLRLRHPRLTLDHVLVDPRIAVAGVEFVAVRGSDHRAVVVDLDLR